MGANFSHFQILESLTYFTLASFSDEHYIINLSVIPNMASEASNSVTVF